MARIRTIKPDFFRHEGLQDLEVKYPGMYPMLVFSALWGHCDKNGVFEWKPRLMQLDIIPFVWEATGKQLGSTLELLVNHQFVFMLTDGQKVYGFIPTFKIHQRVNGKESQAPPLYPQPHEMTEHFCKEATGKQPGSNREATGTTGREGKGREEEGNKITCPERCSEPEFRMLLKDGTYFDVSDSKIQEWEKIYDSVNVRKELAKMQEWCVNNASQRKTRSGCNSFICKWLNKSDNGKKTDHEAKCLSIFEQEVARVARLSSGH